MTTSTTPDTNWRPLGGVDATALGEARLQAHHAAQIIVSAAISYLPKRDDDSHTNLEWLPEHAVLATNVIEPKRRLRLGLRLDGLELAALESGHERSVFPLDGRTLPEALLWLSNTLTSADLDPARLTTEKHYRIPPHAVETGAPYRAGDGAALRELAHAYHDAWIIASAVQSRTPGAADPRCWPHHFDLATLITLQKGSEAGTRTIGVGLSPGDDSYGEPYFYVTPYPYPPAEGLGRLPLGRWHTKGWLGAVLTATELVRGDAAAQRERARTFVDAAMVECRRALSGA